MAEHQALKIAIDEEETLTVAKVVFGDLRSTFAMWIGFWRYAQDMILRSLRMPPIRLVRNFMGNLLATWAISMDSRFMGPRL